MRILYGSPNGTFTPAASYAVGNVPAAVATGDFDGDGTPDLAVAYQSDGTTEISGGISFLLNKGDGTFNPALNATAHTSPVALAVDDFNQDSMPDVVVANLYSGDTSVLLNGRAVPVGSISGTAYRDDGAGNLTPLAGLTVYIDLTGSPGPAPGDLVVTTDGDGKYSFANVPRSNYAYTVLAVPPAGSQFTTPDFGYWTVLVRAGRDSSANNFVAGPSAAPLLSAVAIDDESGQRSRVRSLTLSFDRPVTLADSALKLQLLNTGGSGSKDGAAPTDASAVLAAPTSPDGGFTWVYTFLAGTTWSQASAPADGSGVSLADGTYALTLDHTKVSANDVTMAADFAHVPPPVRRPRREQDREQRRLPEVQGQLQRPVRRRQLQRRLRLRRQRHRQQRRLPAIQEPLRLDLRLLASRRRHDRRRPTPGRLFQRLPLRRQARGTPAAPAARRRASFASRGNCLYIPCPSFPFARFSPVPSGRFGRAGGPGRLTLLA